MIVRKSAAFLVLLYSIIYPCRGYIIDGLDYSPYEHTGYKLQGIPHDVPKYRKDGFLHPVSLKKELSSILQQEILQKENTLDTDEHEYAKVLRQNVLPIDKQEMNYDGTPQDLNNVEEADKEENLLKTLSLLSQNLEGEAVVQNILKKHISNMNSQNLVGLDIDPDLLWRLFLYMMRSDLYLPSRDESIVQNKQCIADLTAIYNPVTPEEWITALGMVDSWGKMPDGYLYGNFYALGAFDECLALRLETKPVINETAGGFKGQHCTIGLDKQEKPANMKEVGMPSMVLPSILALPQFPSSFSLYATCMPSSCTEDDLINSLNNVLDKNNKSVLFIGCQTDDPTVVDYTPGLIAMICVLSIFAFLLLAGAAVDTWIEFTGKDELKKGPLKFLLVFSVTSNLQKMFMINLTENKEAITSLYGMRVLSMTWVVWCHQYMLIIFMDGNKFSVLNILNSSWLEQVILNGFPSVDSFFFMSGLLVAYGVLKEKQRSGSINLIVFYVHRFIRLAIPILILSGFLATFAQYLSHGPFKPFQHLPGSTQDLCQRYWWRDALFVTNFFLPPEGSIEGTSCLGVCWYTAVDFQLFIFTPLMLFPFIWDEPLKTSKRKLNILRIVWLGSVMFISILIPGIITGVEQLPPTGVTSTTDQHISYILNKDIYMKPWCRAQPYLVGMALGIILRMDPKREIKLKRWQVILGWMIAVATGLAVIFGMYDYNQSDHPREYYWPDSIFYGSLHRFAWGVALAWVVFACQYGYGGLVNSFLSHPSWQPLSRLTYCMFLVAIPMQIIIFTANAYYPLHFSHLDTVLQTVCALFVSGIGAVLLSLCGEGPVIGLERLLLRRGPTKS